MKSATAFIILIILCFASIAGAQTGAKPVAEKTSSTDAKTANNEDCGCDATTGPDTLATINGVKITTKDIEEPIKEQIEKLHNQVIEARKRELDLQINSKLLDREAKKRGISTIKLLETEVVSKVKEPTEAEARAFYDQNKSRISEEFKDANPAIVNHLLTQRQSDEAKKLADRLRAAADVKLLVENVTPPANEAERARVLATINGARITSGTSSDVVSVR